MGEQEIKALETAINSLINMIDRQTVELRKVLGPLEQLPELTREASSVTQTGLSDLQTVTVQIKLAEITAGLKGHEALLKSEMEAYEAKVKELKEDVSRISDRYEKTLEDMDGEAKSRVRSFDAPVLDLLERFFPSIQERYAKQLLPGRKAISEEAFVTQRRRGSVMESMVRKLVETIKEFISSRQEVEKFLDAQIIRSSDNKEKSFFLPVTVISKTDQKKIHLALAAEEEQQVSSRKEIESIIQQVFETNKLKLAGTTDTERRNELAIALGEINQKSKDPRERLAASVLEACISDSRLTIYEVER